METFWYAVLGALFVTYFALGGLDYGVGLLLPSMPREADRRRALNAVGPRFLGNEVWIVAASGVLIAAFPRLDSELFGAAYPLVVVLLLALVAVNAGWQLRSRGRYRRGFDALIVAASAVLAVGWGVLLGSLLTGRPTGADGHVEGYGGLLGWYPLLVGLATAGLFVVHGAMFLAWRLDGGGERPAPGRATPGRATSVAGVLFGPVAALAALAALLGYASRDVRAAVANPVAATALALAVPCALGLAWYLLRAGRAGPATLATAIAAGLPVLATGVALYPAVLVSTVDPVATLTVSSGAAGPDALRLLLVVAGPLIPVLLAVQVAAWWLFRQRDDPRVPVHW